MVVQEGKSENYQNYKNTLCGNHELIYVTYLMAIHMIVVEKV